MRNYTKIQYEIYGQKIGKEEAMEKDYYEIAYYSEFNKRDKVELFQKNKLSQLIYPDKELPFDDIIKEHLISYPNIKIEIHTPKVFLEDGGYVRKSYIFIEHKNFELIKECYFDKENNLVKEVEMDKHSKPLVINIYRYDENGKLIEAIEKNPQGDVVGRVDFEISQKF